MGIYKSHIPVSSRVIQTVFKLFQVFFQSGDQRLVYILPPLLTGDERRDVPAQTGDALGMEAGLGLAYGQDGDGIRVFAAALGADVEVAHGVQLVAEKLRPDGLVGGRGEDIQDSATEGKLTAALHHAASAVARGGKPPDQIAHGIFLPRFQGKGGLHQHRSRHGAQAQRLPGENLKPGLSLGQLVQLPQPLLLPGPADHCRVIEGQLPSRQNGNYGAIQEALQLLLKPPGSHIVLTNEHQGAIHIMAQPGNHVTAVDLTDAGDGHAFAALQGGHNGTVFRDVF